MNSTNEHQAIALAAELSRKWMPESPPNLRINCQAAILAAINKAHQDGWYEGRDYEIKLRAAQPQRSEPVACTCHLPEQTECPLHGTGWPQLPQQPPATDGEHWTPEYVEQLYLQFGSLASGSLPEFYKRVSDAHEAALAAYDDKWRKDLQQQLAAEREKRKAQRAQHLAYGRLFQDKLAAERERHENDYGLLQVKTHDANQQLLAAQAAIAAYIKSNYNNLGQNFEALQKLNLSALDKHVAEVMWKARTAQAADDRKHYEAQRKPLVDCLVWLRDNRSAMSFREQGKMIDNALKGIPTIDERIAEARKSLVDALRTWLDNRANEIRERINTGLHNVEPLDEKLSAFIETRTKLDALAEEGK